MNCPVCLASVGDRGLLGLHIEWHHRNDKDPDLVDRMWNTYQDLELAASEAPS